MKRTKEIIRKKDMKESFMPFLADQLANSMEFYNSAKDFAKHMNKETGIPFPTLMKVYEGFWELSPMKTMFWGVSDWAGWLSSNFGIKESKMKEKDEGTIVEIQKDTEIKGTDIILEKGDKIKVFSERVDIYASNNRKKAEALVKLKRNSRVFLTVPDEDVYSASKSVSGNYVISCDGYENVTFKTAEEAIDELFDCLNRIPVMVYDVD